MGKPMPGRVERHPCRRYAYRVPAPDPRWYVLAADPGHLVWGGDYTVPWDPTQLRVHP